MIPTDPILSSLTAAAACSFALDRIQKTKLVPWVNEHSTTINTVIKLAMSAAATIGIAHAWTPAAAGGGTLVLTIPPLNAIVVALWHWGGQFALQHGFGQVVFPGTAAPVQPPTS